jgi:hypothetical protein
VVPADRLLDVGTDAQGPNMPRVRRSDLHFTGDLALPTLQFLPELRGVDISHRVLAFGARDGARSRVLRESGAEIYSVPLPSPAQCLRSSRPATKALKVHTEL